ncbi:MAG: AprI/Inh family metalloprotease inhibitor [Pseudomonadota bacterium]
MTPAPTTPVTTSSLPQPITFGTPQPVAGQTLDQAAGTPTDSALSNSSTLSADNGVTTATLDPTTGADASLQPAIVPPAGATGATLAEDDLIGAWSAATPLATCAINLSLTTWQGGFRASTRNCADVQLAALGAWSIDGQQVLLRDSEGALIARLFQNGDARYSGQFETGQAVTVFR